MIDHMQCRDLPEGWDSALPIFPADAKGMAMATRDSSGKVLDAIAEKMLWRQTAPQPKAAIRKFPKLLYDQRSTLENLPI